MIKTIATNPYNVVFELDIIHKAFENGLDLLYVFKPKFTHREMEEFILSIDSKYHNRLIIATYTDLAEKYKTRGYLVEKDKFGSFFYNLFILKPFLKRNPDMWIFSQVKQISQLETLDKRAKHVFIYPVFIENYNDNIIKLVDSTRLNAMKDERRVYAMGGVSINRIKETEKLGFSGFVLQSAIWRSPKPIDSFLSICEQISPENRNVKIV